ncbi:unnamed protein product [Closterium sp. NIES-65]|nr:unnamed protein product [Closterium sp. NIES-65]
MDRSASSLIPVSRTTPGPSRAPGPRMPMSRMPGPRIPIPPMPPMFPPRPMPAPRMSACLKLPCGESCTVGEADGIFAAYADTRADYAAASRHPATMAATTVSASLKAASLVQPKVNAASLKAAPVSQAFGLKTASSKVSCSLEENVRGFVQKAADAGKTAALALASTALLASSGKYQLTKMCLEPTSFTVKAESQFKGQGEEFQKTKLMTRLTYTLDEIEGPLEVSGDKIKFTEVDGIDYAAVTVQLSASAGSFLVPSYRGATFLDPKGRGGAQGYDSAVALPAGGFGDNEKLRKENEKSYKSLSGNITFSVAKSNVETGEIGGVFTSVQPSDTDMGAKVPKDVKIQGIWYAQVN